MESASNLEIQEMQKISEASPYLQPNHQKVNTRVAITIFGLLITATLFLFFLLVQVKKEQKELEKVLEKYK